jgi:protein phosphatase
LKLAAHGISHPGAVRTSNQDRLLVEPDLGLYVICDGMGGHQHGEVAAEIALAAIRHYVDSSRNPAEVTWPFGYNMNLSVESNRLLTAIRLANRQVWRKAEEELESAGMGTTIAAILAGPSAATVANVGDSRIFRCRAGKLEQISIDDTMVNVMLSKGVITPDAIASHPMRHMLTQAAGSQESVEVHLREMTFEPGETWLICSDGLSGVVDEGFITSVLSSGAGIEDCTQQLLDAALSRGAPDNVSALLLRPA